MGAEASLLSSCSTDCSPILSTPDWSLHHAQHADRGPLSVFVDRQYKVGVKIDTLALHLRQFRHPSIIHYVAWCQAGGAGYLFTEKVSPLSVVRKQQEELAICLGLLEVTQALCFLHITASVSHNNISQAAVFVTPEGRWKLGGLELVGKGGEEGHAKDIQALGLLVTELLADCSSPGSLQFRDYAKSQMLLPDVARLPSLSTILQHQFFSQPFPAVVQFLKSLPLQTSENKLQFFTSLQDTLRTLPSSVVALQLLPLLLSRYVFMDVTARTHLLPHLLVPQSSSPPPPNTSPLLPLSLYLTHLVPHLKLLFLVPDTCVRMTLLTQWPHFIHHLDKDTLTDELLPSLLLGMRDTDPTIVSTTLRCLADLVPILGPEVVVGTNRTKIFSDGSPGKSSRDCHLAQDKTLTSKIFSPVQNVEEKIILKIGDDDIAMGDDWDDWNDADNDEIPENENKFGDTIKVNQEFKVSDSETSTEISERGRSSEITYNVEKMIKNIEDLDIMKLDIKVNKAKTDKVEDVDFFADMTPDIVKGSSAIEEFEEKLARGTDSSVQSAIGIGKFAAPNDDDHDESGWGEEDLDWGD
eukprot:GFUD01026367.1.p1 GENE.GFUD01026367.1~~GFUD01026367.1.p1  ORF type:complete len:582 (-),score=220.45 GFUD01026367.1:206-1951(-)